MAKYEKINNQGKPVKILDVFIPEGKKTIDDMLEAHPEYRKSYEFEKHWHRSLEIVLPVFGKTYLWIDGSESLLQQGNYVLINSTIEHNFTSKDNEPYKGYCLQISYEFLKEHIENYDDYTFMVPTNLQHKQEVLSAIYAIIAASFEENPYSDLAIEGKLLEFIYLLMNYCAKKKNEVIEVKSEKYRNQIMDIVSFIDSNSQNEISMVDVADHFGLSYGYTSKLFKEHLGMTMKTYLMISRLRKSVDDLLNTDLPIIQIALKNGFPNSKSFYKEFEARYKMTPTAYRKDMK